MANAKGPGKAGDPAILLGVLSAVESDACVTQRKLSGDLGIALGLANAYLRRCVRKGWIKIGQVPMRRYAYYLTPRGFSEKARLTAEYLSWSLEFFRRARNDAARSFDEAKSRGQQRFVLVGAGDLAEVVVLSAIQAEVEVIGILDDHAPAERCAGRPVFRSVDALAAFANQQSIRVDALMITATRAPMEACAGALALAAALRIPATPDRVLLPSVLKISWPEIAAKATHGR